MGKLERRKRSDDKPAKKKKSPVIDVSDILIGEHIDPLEATVEDISLPPKYESFKTKVKINREDLEQSLEEQPELFAQVSEYAIKWSAIRDLRKNAVDKIRVTLDRQIREQASESGTRITEAAIANQIGEDEDYREANLRYLEAKYYADLWLSLVNSYTQRSYALKDLVTIVVKQLSMDNDVISTEADHRALMEAKSRRASKLRSEALKERRALKGE